MLGRLQGFTAGRVRAILMILCAGLMHAAQAQSFQVLYSFPANGLSGERPTGDLARDAAGNLYGTTADGGSSTACNDGCGVVFKLDPQGHETVLHSFSNTDGSFPFSVILDPAGTLYGVTVFGGNAVCEGFGSCGLVYKLDPAGNLTILHNFTGGTDGSNPEASLIIDGQGNLYGTTLAGGFGCQNENPAGCGVIFKIDPSGNETILHYFDGDGGRNSQAGLLLDSAGNLYGTTTDGGAFSTSLFGKGCCWGTVFKLDPKGKETVLHSFSELSPDGSYPESQLIEDASGNLYGTTESPILETGVFGTVFKLGAKGGPMTELFGFNYDNGGYPVAGLTRDSAGNLYGTTLYTTVGCGCGNVFMLSPNNNLTILHTFAGRNDGAFPADVLVLDGEGNFTTGPPEAVVRAASARSMKSRRDVAEMGQVSLLFEFLRANTLGLLQFDRFLGDVFGADFEFLDQLPGRAGIAEAVLHADGAGDNRNPVKLGSSVIMLLTRQASAANLMLLGSDNNAGFAGGAKDRRLVDRLQGVNVDDARLVAKLGFQDPGGAHRLRHHRTAGNDCQVFVLVRVIHGRGCSRKPSAKFASSRAEANHIRLAEIERRVLVGDDRRGLAREANIFRPDVGAANSRSPCAFQPGRRAPRPTYWAGRTWRTNLPAPGASRRPGRRKLRRALRQSAR